MKLNFRNYDLQLAFLFCVLVAVIVLYFDRDFGINVITEILGVAITVLIINNILEKRERRKRVSIDKRIIRDLQSIIASYFSIWKHFVWEYHPDSLIQKEKDLSALFPSIIEQTDLSKPFTIISLQHPESWELLFHKKSIKDCFTNYTETLTGQIKTFLLDYKIYLEPELLDLLLSILESKYVKKLQMMHQADAHEVILLFGQDPSKLNSHFNADDTEHFQQFTQLISYSNKMKKLIEEFTPIDVEIYELKKFFIHPTKVFR
jgi:hypothetical protein